MTQIVSIEMLGGLRLRVGDSTITRFRTQKTAALLGYLAFYPQRVHSREELVDLFWPESDIDAGRGSLRASLASLRQQLEQSEIDPDQVLLADRKVVRLNPELVETDVSRFESSISAAARIVDPHARSEGFAGAAELYRGPLLSGHYDDWILQERDRLQQAYASLLRNAAASHQEIGEIPRSIQFLQRLVSIEPLQEEAHSDLMRLLAATGNVSAALRQYRELERILRDELDTTPSAEARELFEQLSHGNLPDDLKDLARRTRKRPLQTPAATPPPPEADSQRTPASDSNAPSLPLFLTRFFGREEELEAISRILRSGETRLLTLTGPGGSGKSRLAVEAARGIGRDLGEVAFAPMSDLSDARLIDDAVAAAFNVTVGSGADALELLVEALRGRKALLLVDSFEQLVEDGAPMLLRLLQSAPSLTLLVTSRRRLEIGGELEFAVTPLPVPSMAGSPDVLSRFASVQLFVDRAASARAGFEMHAENAAAIAAVCERLEGIPLAIELAAAWADILTPAQILARLSHRFELLASRRRDLPPRHRTLRATFDWTYRQLEPEIQRFFSLLSVFRGGWSLEAVEVVCEEPRAIQFLQQLRERSILDVAEQGEQMRFRLLDTVREYAEEQLSAADSEVYRGRHLGYFQGFAANAKAKFHGPEQSMWLDRVQQEHDNIRAALEWARDSRSEIETALRLAGDLQFFWGVRSHVKEGLRWYEALLPLAEDLQVKDSTLAAANHGAGVLSYAVGDFSEAQEHLARAVPLYRSSGDPKGAADSTTYLGLSWEQKDHARAREILLDARTQYEQAGDDGGLAHALKCLAANALNAGDPERARELIEQGLALYRKHEDRRGVCMMLGQLGSITLSQGRYLQAEEVLKEQLEIARDLEDVGHMAFSLETLGKAVAGRGDYVVARGFLDQCLSLYRELGHRWGVVTALHNLGMVAMEQGSFTEAAGLYAESLQIAREIGEARSQAAILNDMAVLAHRSGDYEEAARGLAESGDISRRLGDRWAEMKLLRDSGLLAMDRGELDAAERLHQESLEIAREVGDRHSVGMALYNLGDVSRHRGDFKRAREYWEETRAIDRELGIKGGSVLGALATVAARGGDLTRARKLWEASLKEHWAIGDRLGVAEALSGLADVAAAGNEWETAARLHGTADQLRNLVGAPTSAHRRAIDESRAAKLHSALGKAAAEALIEEGRSLQFDRAVASALESGSEARSESTTARA